MNALSAVVAAYGLLEDSAAVVIGAMLIATLLGPIAGIALALVDGDSTLLRRALLAEIGGVALVLGIALVPGRIHQDIPLGRQILFRTSPNIMDLMIALAGGAAGAYATISPRVSAGLVGVAVATALVPPLAACSLCLARGEIVLGLGAFLLFFTNLVAVQFGFSAVFALHGFHRVTRRPPDLATLLRRNAVSAVLLVALAGGLSYSLSRSVARQQFQKKVRLSLRAIPGKLQRRFPRRYADDDR